MDAWAWALAGAFLGSLCLALIALIANDISRTQLFQFIAADNASASELVQRYGFVIAAIIAAIIAVWRAVAADVANRVGQAANAREAERMDFDRFQRGAAMLDSERLPIRIASVITLRDLGVQQVRHRQQVISLLEAYVRDARAKELAGAATFVAPTEDIRTALVALFAVADAGFDGSLELSDIDLTSLNMTAISVPTTRFNNTIFNNVNFNSATWVGCNFFRAVFTEARIARSKFLNSSFVSAVFVDARLPSTTFQDCNFDGTSFSGAYLRQCQFIGCQIKDCDFSGAMLRGTKFETPANNLLAWADQRPSIESERQHLIRLVEPTDTRRNIDFQFARNKVSLTWQDAEALYPSDSDGIPF